MSQKGYLSKGIALSYKGSGETYTKLTNLQEVPEMGGDTEAVEITTLDDAAFQYMDGLLNYGDAIVFTFLYDPLQFGVLQELDGPQDWKLELPDGLDGALDTSATWSGPCSVKLNSVGPNAPLTYTLAIRPQSEIVFA